MPLDTRELMKQVRRIRVVTSRRVSERLAGQYHSVFRGRGIEFDEVREYAHGDDVRDIDWNVTARMGHPFVKRFAEERQLTVVFLVDVSASQRFGSRDRTKAEVAAEFACLIALSAVRNHDKVGLILFSDRIEKCLPPRRGRTAVMRLVREMLAAAGGTPRGTRLSPALRFLNHVQKKRAVVFLLSDFLGENALADLRITARRHDLICCRVSDPRESELADAGLLCLADPETGETALVDTASPSLRERFRQESIESERSLAASLAQAKIDTVPLSTDRPFVEDVRRLFRRRQIRTAHG